MTLAVLPLTAYSVVSPLYAGLPVPEYSSRPGAPYTLYLNFGGFSYSGQWVDSGRTPGVIPAYTTDGNTAAFSTTDLSAIKEIWARVAEKYSTLNINVTTVDPAVAAGQAATDAQRQNYYDATPQLQQTIIGGSAAWYGNAGGVSYLGVTQGAQVGSNGYHTNWVFSAQYSANDRQSVAEATGHENGHALGLYHQSDYSGNTVINEYSTNNNANGNGSFAPLMGVTYSSQRGLWRSGTATAGGRIIQNDFSTLGSNANITLVDSGIGHTIPTATPLPLTGTSVNPALAKGVITPITLSNPNPIGVNNYTKDYFSFFSLGTAFSLVARNGSQNITPGAADPGATLDSTLKIYNSTGTVVATGTRTTNTLSVTLSTTLPVGVYYAEIASVGGYTSTFDPTATYFTAGSYFLTGTNLYTKFTLTGQNLSGVNLSSADLSSANLSTVNFTNATLTSANFRSATLTSSTFTGVTLRGINLSATTALGFTFNQLAATASFTSRDLSGGTNLSLNTLTGWNLSSQNLTSAIFDSSNLTTANLLSANLTSASFISANLSTTTLTSANLTSANLTNANLTSANLANVNLAAGTLASANLTNTNLTNANLTNANLSSATLANATLTSATIKGANLTAATSLGLTTTQFYSTSSYLTGDLSGGTNLSRNDLTGWNFDSKNLASASFLTSTLASASFVSATLTSAAFNSATLTSANLTSAAATSANFTSANLTNANFANSTLASATFTGANIAGANFSNTSANGLTFSQLSATPTYTSRVLGSINLSLNTFLAANLSTQNLVSANLSSANFSSANFTSANGSSADFSASTFISTSFGRATLTGANFAGSNLNSASFAQGSAISANFTSATLTATSLFSTNLTGANLSFANLTGANLSTTTLTSATVAGANFSATSLTSTQLASTASFQQQNLTAINLTGLVLTGWNLASQNLSSATLRTANLSTANLTSANLTGANIGAANFTAAIGFTPAQLYSTASYAAFDLSGGTRFSNLNLTGWNLASQNLTSANFTSATLTNASLTSANLRTAILTAANATGADLFSASLATATLSTANFTSANLASATFTGGTLTSANFTLADTRSAVGLTLPGTATTRGLIRNTGTITAFTFNTGETLRVRPLPLAARTTGTITGPLTGTATLQVDAGAQLNFQPTANSGSSVRMVDNVALALQGSPGQIATARSLTITATASDRAVLPTVAVLSSVSITDDGAPLGTRNYYGILDLGTNDAVFRNGSLTTLLDQARAFVSSAGAQGLGSSSTIPNTRLAVVDNLAAPADTTPYYSAFDGVPVSTTDVLARFTYIGDTNLDGTLDGSDLSNLLEGFSSGQTGWRSGDFNYDGIVNTTDITSFTTAYDAYLLNPLPLGSPAGNGTPGGAIPEPTTLASLLLAPLALRRRPRR